MMKSTRRQNAGNGAAPAPCRRACTPRRLKRAPGAGAKRAHHKGRAGKGTAMPRAAGTKAAPVRRLCGMEKKQEEETQQ